MGPSKGPADWFERQVAFSNSVFVARVMAVSDEPANPALIFESATVEVQQSFKGAAGIKIVRTSLCNNFVLKAGDVRIFFVDANGVIIGCTDYRYFMNDRQAIAELRRIADKHEN